MIAIDLFGGIRVEREGISLTGRAAQKKRLAILPPLVTSRERGVSRDKLVALLWPESDAPRARHQLASSLYELRRMLGDDAIVSAADTVRLNPDRLCSDVWIFEDALERGEAERAVAQYRGPFLDGFFLSGAVDFDRWIEGERLRLARRCAEALGTLAEAREQCSDWLAAAARWQQLAALEPYSGPTVRRWMRALIEAGDRAGAWRCAQAHEALLRTDLDVAPDPEVLALASEIRIPPKGTRFADRGRSGPAVFVAHAPHTAVANLASAPPLAADLNTTPTAGAAVNRRTRFGIGRKWLAVAFPLLAILAGGIWRQRVNVPAAAVPSLAVLPFEDQSGDTANAYFADAMTDAVIGDLLRLKTIRVISRGSVMRFARTRKPPATIARELGVEALVQGTIARDARHVRVTLRLGGAVGDRAPWRATFERELRDVPLLQRELSDAIAGVLRANVGVTGSDSLVRSNPIDALAYDSYLRGRYAWSLRSREGLEQAILHFRAAIDRVPNYAAAYAGLADVYVLLGYLGYYPAADMFPKGKSAALKAIELGGARADAYTALGMELTWERLWSEAENAFRRAIQLSPGYATAHHWYSLELLTLGRFEDARREARIASELDPLSLQISNTYAIVLYFAGDTAGAIREFVRTVAGEPDSTWIRRNPWLLANMGRVNAAAGQTEEALRLLGHAIALVPAHPRALADLAAIHAQRGDRDRALAIFARADSTSEQYPFFRAKLFASMGESDSAFAWLARVREWSPSNMSDLRDPILVRLRNDPRYARMLRALGLS